MFQCVEKEIVPLLGLISFSYRRGDRKGCPCFYPHSSTKTNVMKKNTKIGIDG